MFVFLGVHEENALQNCLYWCLELNLEQDFLRNFMKNMKITYKSPSFPSKSQSKMDFKTVKKKKKGSFWSQGPAKPKVFTFYFCFLSAMSPNWSPN